MVLRAPERPVALVSGADGTTDTHPRGVSGLRAGRWWPPDRRGRPRPLPRLTRVTEATTTTGEAPPPPAAPAERDRRTWVWFGSIGAALVVLTGVLWLAGGFERRTDLQTVIAPGTTITTGPYELTFTSATVQRTQGYRQEEVWEVVIAGSGRVTGDEALAPSSLNWFMTARDPGSRTALEPAGQDFGPDSRSGGTGQHFTPGLAPIPYRLSFEFPGEIAAPTTVQLAVWELEYRDSTLLKTGYRDWAPGQRFSTYDDLPAERLPDDLD